MTITFPVTITSLPISGGTLRAIHTFILRLLANSAEPEALRGDLRPMPEGEPIPFADEEALLALLRRLIRMLEELPGLDERQTDNR